MSGERLALNGGVPVRSKPWPRPSLGTGLLGAEELRLLAEVIEAKSPFRAYGLSTPHMVDDFEAEAKAFVGAKYALATATGSASLYAAMAGLGIGPGDEVIIPSFSWYTDFCAPVLLGATPVFADIDRSLNIDPDDIERKITKSTKAVVVVHFQGAAADMDRILGIARKHGLKVVEDCAQAFGACYRGRRVGSLGDVACFSLQQNKMITSGEGGLLLSSDARIFERAVRFHDLGLLRPSFEKQLEGLIQESSFCGFQSRMNEFTGAVALAQLRKLEPAILSVTRRYFRAVRERVLAECPDITFRAAADPDGDAGIAFYVDCGSPARGEWFRRALAAEGIRPGPSSNCKNLLHDPLVTGKRMAHPDLPPFGRGWPGESIHYGTGMCPNTDAIVASLSCVAISPALTEADLDDLVAAVVKVWRALPSAVREEAGIRSSTQAV